MELFEGTCFGHLMDMKPIILYAQIIHQLVARQANVDVALDDLDDKIFFLTLLGIWLVSLS